MRTTAGLLDLFVSISVKDEASDSIDEVSQNFEKLGEKIAKSASSGGDGLDKLSGKAKNTTPKIKEVGDAGKKIGEKIGEGSKQGGSLLDQLAAKAKTAGNNFAASFAKIGVGIGAAFTAKKVLEFGAACVQSAAEAETGFAKVNTLLSSGTDTNAYFDSIKKASLETGVAVTDFSEAVYSSISASVDQANAVDFTAQAVKLAKGGFTDTATAVDVLTTAINAYGLSSSDATSIADKLITTQNLGKTTVGELADAMGRVIPTANSFGVNLDNLAAAYAVTTKNGIATAESTTYINGMLNELGKSGTTAANVLKKQTGKSFSQLMASGYTLADVLTVLQDEATKTGVSIGDMFGSQEAAKAANTLVGHADDFASSLNAMQNSAGATEAAYGKMADTVAERLQKVTNHFGQMKDALGEDLSPGINTLLGALEKLLPVIDTVAGAFGTILGGTVSGAATVVDAFATGIQNVTDPAHDAREAIAKQTTTMEDAYDATVKYGQEYVRLKKEFEASKKTYAETGQAMASTTPEIEQARIKWEQAQATYQNFVSEQAKAAATAAEPANVFQAATDEYVASSTALLEQYQATFEATLGNVESWFGPFDKAQTSVKTSYKDITANLQSQIDFNNQYADNLQYLADNGLGSLSEALQSYGADGAAYTAAIVDELQAAGGASTEAGQAILENLTGLMDGVKESQSGLATSMTEMDGSFAEQMQVIAEQYAQAIEGLDKSDEAMQKAQNTIAAFIGGLDSSKGGIMDTMGDIGAQMTSALQAAIGDVHVTVTASLVMSGRSSAIGMDYVPYNGMPAVLHRGEAVLNSYEADQWRRGRGRGNAQGITIVQNIQSVPQTPVQLAAATQAMFEQARWAM